VRGEVAFTEKGEESCQCLQVVMEGRQEWRRGRLSRLAVEGTMLTIDEVCVRIRRTVLRKIAAAAEKACVDAAKIWADVRALLWRALGPFPEAREAVAHELEAMVDWEQRE